ncbi:MAG: sugar transferase [Lachnospiraceae bacterium]|nr:sugar transferase [Lachnospiraceae bacterium]
MQSIQLGVKLFFDFFVCAFFSLLLLPFWIIVSIAICVDSRGSPPFFLQERLGKNGKVFKIIKFRTMVCNAEEIGDGLIVKDERDVRITRVGRFLRKTSLDELPQLFNILKGDMSIVGPRPPVTYHPYNGYESYSDFAKKRFDVRPGITGLAQVKKRNSVSWDERIAIDVEYVERFNIALDLWILANTISSMRYKEEYIENDKCV